MQKPPDSHPRHRARTKVELANAPGSCVASAPENRGRVGRSMNPMNWALFVGLGVLTFVLAVAPGRAPRP